MRAEVLQKGNVKTPQTKHPKLSRFFRQSSTLLPSAFSETKMISLLQQTATYREK